MRILMRGSDRGRARTRGRSRMTMVLHSRVHCDRLELVGSSTQRVLYEAHQDASIGMDHSIDVLPSARIVGRARAGVSAGVRDPVPYTRKTDRGRAVTRD